MTVVAHGVDLRSTAPSRSGIQVSEKGIVVGPNSVVDGDQPPRGSGVPSTGSCTTTGSRAPSRGVIGKDNATSTNWTNYGMDQLREPALKLYCFGP